MRSRNKLSAAVAVASLSPFLAQAAIEEVVVTATKREASLQDVPVAVSALGQEKLDQLGVANFEDYLLELPGITAGGSGPGQNTVYIRGVASTTPNLTTAGVAGLAPNVAFYLDEQPLAQPGRNLDVYAADLQRIEVLSGPQGTLFGASSQAGTVRLITNKPDPSGTYGRMKFGTSFMEEGELSADVTGMLNLPVSDNLTLRGVVYVDNQGGYIDNVPGTRDLRESARFREEGAMRSNGVPVSLQRAGLQSASKIASYNPALLEAARSPDLSRVNFLAADNAEFVDDDINETTYSGFRLSGLYDINDKWSLLVAHSQQEIDSEGVFFADPELGDLEVQRFTDDTMEDKFSNTAWTLTGLVGALEVVYTGAFTDRETDQRVDYTDYMFVGQYLPYYICDSTVSYPEYNYGYVEDGLVNNVPEGTCQGPDLYVDSQTDTEVMTHELRIATDPSRAIRLTAGGFYSDLELTELNDFRYPGSTEAVIYPNFGDPQQGFAPQLSQSSGYRSSPGPFPDGTVFRNDVRRTDEQMGLFGELTFDLTDSTYVTLGARWYDIEVDFDGAANASFCDAFAGNGVDNLRFGTNISDLYDGDGVFEFIGDCTAGGGITFTRGQTFDEISGIIAEADPYSYGRGRFTNAPNAISDAEIQGIVNALDAPDSASTSGTIFKATFTWEPTMTQMYYVTWSEGFRPGLLNRPGGAPGPAGYTVPFELDTDEVTNLELGWKSSYLQNTLQFNGSLFFVDISDLQTTIFDPSISNLFFSDNAADAEVLGLEGDIIWQPDSVPGLTVNAAFSFLDTEITDVLVPTDDVREGDSLAFAPEFQGNLRVRYEWNMGSDLTAHVMPSIAVSDEAFSDIITINRAKMDSWAMANITAGVRSGQWSAEVFVNNITDERAELATNFVFDRERVTYSRPRHAGLRFSYDF
jgi:iron complex outermembrane receptor protein